LRLGRLERCLNEPEQGSAEAVYVSAMVGEMMRRVLEDALVDLAGEISADLLVVGNLGLSTIAGRLLGSVPANVARRSKIDVLIVHTS